MAAPTQKPPTAPKTRLGLSLAERIKVIEARQMGKSMRQLAAQFGCGKTQILNTLAQKERYIREWEVMGRNNPSIGARKRFRHTRNEQINKSVFEWYQQQVATGLRVTGPMLQRQARLYAAHSGIVNFAASNGWLANFRRFYNIVSCSPHPRKRQNTPDQIQEEDNQQASTSSNLIEQPEFVPARNGPVNSNNFLLQQHPSEINQTKGKQVSQGDELVGSILIKSEPISDQEDEVNYNYCRGNNLNGSVMSSIPPNNVIQMQRADGTVLNMLGNRNTQLKEENVQPGSSTLINHRKRRLLDSEGHSTTNLQMPLTSVISEPFHSSEERRMPKLHPLTPLKTCFAEFISLARSKGLISLTVKDDCGNEWVEIRDAVPTYRVPKFGYPTHLSRLIVDSSLQYYLEVLGYCVQNGSLLLKDVNSSLNRSEATSILCALSGGFIVCAGIESVLDHVPNLHMRSVQEIGTAQDVFATLPDHRYRSNECLKWIDRRIGPRCQACKSVSSDYSIAPMDLRCSSSHHRRY